MTGAAARSRGLSLRARLLLITTALLAAGLAVSSVVAIATLRSHLIDRVDERLVPLATVLSRLSPELLPASRSGVPRTRSPIGLDLFDRAYVALLAPDGTLRDHRMLPDGDPGRGPLLPALDAAAVTRSGGRPFDVPGRAGDGSWRVLAVPRAAPWPSPDGAAVGSPDGAAVGSPDGAAARGGDGVVVVAVSLEGVRSTLGRLALVCLVTAVVLLTLLAVAGWFAVRAGLRPLRRIEETVALAEGGDLSRRVPGLAAPGTEVGRLSDALNGMLAQLERAFADREESEARMRRFVADAGHELRTPLFGIKGFSELHRMGGLPDVDRAMTRIESEAGRLVRLVEDLLLLARLDEGESALRMELAPMDLRTLAADAHHDLLALSPARPVALTGPRGGPAEAAPVLGDEARLRQVVTNLVANAVTHTPPDAPVRIGVGTDGEEAVLVIEDGGPGMTAGQAARVFDRFYRVDGSRSRDAGGGAGLGLAIVRSMVAAHGGRVELRTAPGRGARFRVILPSHPGRGDRPARRHPERDP
ncbi:HAMP domain-containing sensor histidine kinase [Streptosporangium sp. NPDC023615]|uniref:sensor histidine kinase n=1 Tax=Streptosporangium sp. NPDC023615 TaxID=3154794 RepID=UPI003427EB58